MKRTDGALIAAIVLITGCAAQRPVPPVVKAKAPSHGSSSYEAVEPQGMKHYQLALGQVASGAGPIAHESPAYPASELGACPESVDVPALLVVDEQGQVSEARIAADTHAPAFDAAVRAAVTGWRFEPLLITHMAADANDEAHVVDQKKQPFSLNYVFHFRCKAGQGAVVTDASQG